MVATVKNFKVKLNTHMESVIELYFRQCKKGYFNIQRKNNLLLNIYRSLFSKIMYSSVLHIKHYFLFTEL